jgi:hypothetical protein
MSPKSTKSATLVTESEQAITASHPEPAAHGSLQSDLAEAPVLALPAVSLVHEAVVPPLSNAVVVCDVASTDDSDAVHDKPSKDDTAEALAARLDHLVHSVTAVEELSRKAREAAADDFARYETLVQSYQQYAQRLGHAGAIRDQAHGVLEKAFGRVARAAAEPLVAEADRVVHAFSQLARAWQDQSGAFLGEHPDVELLLAERQAQEQAAQRAEANAARERRCKAVLASAQEAIRQGIVTEARRAYELFEREFPEQRATIDELRQRLERCERAESDASARQALDQAAEAHARGDLESAVSILEQVDVHGLSRDVSEDVFGRWSDACSRMAQSAGATLVRFAPAQGRGIVLYADPDYPNGLRVFSSLGMGTLFPQGKLVTDQTVLRRARSFREAAPLAPTSWFGQTSYAATPSAAAPIRH